MANTFTQIHLHLIFAVKYRASIIDESWRNELYKYITGIIHKQKHKLIIINGIEDHLHLLIGLHLHQSISDLMQDIKGDSSKWINERQFVKSKFAWQEGYGAFSYGKSDLTTVIDYIKNQENHHKKISFTDEYKSILKFHEIDFDEKYILKKPE